MGYMRALEMVHYTGLDAALDDHLRHNHYPPIPSIMAEPCKAAISAFQDEDFDRRIDLPEGILYRGLTWCKASVLVEDCHLAAFLIEQEGEED